MDTERLAALAAALIVFMAIVAPSAALALALVIVGIGLAVRLRDIGTAAGRGMQNPP